MTTTCTNTPFAPALTPHASGFSALRFIGDMYNAHTQRRALARLDNIHLADLGLTYAQARAEIKRPFWVVRAR